MRAVSADPSLKSLGALAAAFAVVWLAGMAGCGGQVKPEPTEEPPAEEVPGPGAGMCLRCSMLLGFMSNPMPFPGGDPCDPQGPGGPGGPGMPQPEFCTSQSQTYIESLLTCAREHCSAACPALPGPGQAPTCQDGGTPPPPPDAGGASCTECLRSACPTVQQQCETDA